jgi:hypothetical protein
MCATLAERRICIEKEGIFRSYFPQVNDTLFYEILGFHSCQRTHLKGCPSSVVPALSSLQVSLK